MSDGLERAGASARQVAYDTQLELEAITEQIRLFNLRREQLAAKVKRWFAGARGEEAMAAALVRATEDGWHLLLDRRWPGTSGGNVDAIAVGPGGVVVLDAKNWAAARIEGGRLWRGQEPTDDLDTLLRQAEAVEVILAGVGLAPSEVVPVLVLVGQRRMATQVGRIHVVGELELVPALARRGARLSAEQVGTVVEALDRDCPPNAGGRTRPRLLPRHATTAPPSPDPVLLDEQAVIDAMREAATMEPIESWMTWLHPSQATLVRQSWNGPARIRGAAGTGKTVVALHRARYLAERGRRVLVTSFVRNLPEVQGGLFERLAPGVEGVDFLNVHRLAARLMTERGRGVVVDHEATKTCFNLAWMRCARGTALDNLVAGPEYWHEEVQHVIKSRAITDFETYAQLTRVGRGTPLQPVHREAMWAVFVEYERLLEERGWHDWSDLLLLALDEVRRERPDPSYDTVIVDEVQDLSCVGLRILHALVGDSPDGLLLVGDGQQAVYPGGFTLAEAGVSVVGRSRVLERNYRNAGEVLRAALEVVSEDGYDDLDAERLLGARVVDNERDGGHVVRVVADSSDSQRAALLTQVREAHDLEGVRLGDMAVLCATNADAAAWARVLCGEGIESQLLTDYRGRTVEAVKVGTYQRAKGLEFAFVLMPDHEATPGRQRPGESDDAYRERCELARRQRFVAMTRARDGLWLGSVAATI